MIPNKKTPAEPLYMRVHPPEFNPY